jgi:SAM-dependent methyltransferase
LAVRSEAVDRLLSLNREFYQSFAAEFAATRRRIQPGVQRAVKGLPTGARMLDLGCGHGELAAYLKRTGFHGQYLGIDGSPALLDLASQELKPPDYRFMLADLADPGWPNELTPPSKPDAPPASRFNFACAFAVLHHLPGHELRLRLLSDLCGLLAPGAQVRVSVWDFVASPRLRARIRAWSEVGLDPNQIDPNDYLLDWRRGGSGLRYVHHFSSSELGELAGQAGFRLVDEYRSDGEGGRLGLYQFWEAPQESAREG